MKHKISDLSIIDYGSFLVIANEENTYMRFHSSGQELGYWWMDIDATTGGLIPAGNELAEALEQIFKEEWF